MLPATRCVLTRVDASSKMRLLSERCRGGGRAYSFGGAAVRRRTRDRKVAGSTPDRGAIKSTRSTQPSIRLW